VDKLERISENLSMEGESGTLVYRPVTSNETKMEFGRGEISLILSTRSRVFLIE